MPIKIRRFLREFKTTLKFVAVISVIVIPIYSCFDLLSDFKGFEYWFGVFIMFAVSLASCFSMYMVYKGASDKRNKKVGCERTPFDSKCNGQK